MIDETYNLPQFQPIITDDDELNRIVKAVEDETGMSLENAIPAVTFGEDNPIEKVYLLLLSYYPDYEFSDGVNDWVIHIGRQETYDFLKRLTKDELIDPNKSFVLSGKTKPEDAITVFRFLKVMFENKKVLDDGEGFDINEYTNELRSEDYKIMEV